MEATVEQMNETIAVFDGYKRYEDESGVWFMKEGQIKCLHTKASDLQYHTSWDALIKVIKKIKGMHMDILKQAQVMDYMKAAGPINSGMSFLDIEKAHAGVYSFLVWYNSQHKHP
ncbi:MAG TPA: hypothetical protein VL943_09420 [Niabella sp.]|nr:hypothetical protein [Niabella sp.]